MAPNAQTITDVPRASKLRFLPSLGSVGIGSGLGETGRGMLVIGRLGAVGAARRALSAEEDDTCGEPGI